MSNYVCILGRQPAIGIAELESVHGSDAITPAGTQSAVVDTDSFDVTRLGGTVKAGPVVATLQATDWHGVIAELIAQLPAITVDWPDSGKITLGISAYGLGANANRINAAALQIKKQLRRSGSTRIIPNRSPELSSAQVFHNKLDGPKGVELLLVADGSRTLVARTNQVQNISAYTARDRNRPARDARVGMLPPKLAQIILNLARPTLKQTVLDPFCGTGVVLQEALLSGHNAYGTDIEPRMIDYSKENLDWLQSKKPINGHITLEVADATTHTWQSFDVIATETYLGRPFAHEPDPQTLKEVIQTCNTIHKKFLSNLAGQLKPGQTLSLAVPAWFVNGRTHHLPVLDQMGDLGYNRVSFVHVSNGDLIYRRPDQIVGRELVTLTKQ